MSLPNTTGKEIYFGHTITPSRTIEQQAPGVYAVDCGAVHSHRLQAIETKTKQIFEVTK